MWEQTLQSCDYYSYYFMEHAVNNFPIIVCNVYLFITAYLHTISDCLVKVSFPSLKTDQICQEAFLSRGEPDELSSPLKHHLQLLKQDVDIITAIPRFLPHFTKHQWWYYCSLYWKALQIQKIKWKMTDQLCSQGTTSWLISWHFIEAPYWLCSIRWWHDWSIH